MSRFRRFLRIAFSATCLIACVLLIVLWARSYRWTCTLTSFDAGADSSLFVERGNIGAAYYRLPSWSLLHQLWNAKPVMDGLDMPGRAGFYYGPHPSDHSYTLLLLPFWFVVMLVAAVGTAPWLPWWSKRFSLRTLLIATTLVAVVLGLVVYVARR